MKKSAILACVVFALLLPSFVLLRPQAKAKSGKFAEVLEGLEDKKFSLFVGGGHLRLILEEDGAYTIERIGTDYIEVTSQDDTRMLPLGSLELVQYK